MLCDQLTGLKIVLVAMTNLLHLRTKDSRKSETGGHNQHFAAGSLKIPPNMICSILLKSLIIITNSQKLAILPNVRTLEKLNCTQLTYFSKFSKFSQQYYRFLL